MVKPATRKSGEFGKEDFGFTDPEFQAPEDLDSIRSRIRSVSSEGEEPDTDLLPAFIDLDSTDEEEETEEEAEVETASDEYDEEGTPAWEGLHPAEIAARTRIDPDYRGPIGGSDEQILRDLRRLVFSVPLLPQKDVHKLFLEIDAAVFPMVYAILELSKVYLESLFQVVVKVAAGNTYGKNIYEREDLSDVEKETAKQQSRGTFKDHEIRFLKNSYDTFRLFAESGPKKRPLVTEIHNAVGKCAFIRGVYEDILRDFVEKTTYYEELHWVALEAKISGRSDEHHRIVEVIRDLDKKLFFQRSAFAVARDAAKVYAEYTKKRSIIIEPYLRTVYSAARSTARNAHQMLDNFQNGSLGLMRAVSCYSTIRSASFASVAKWWIKQMILLSIKEDANFVKLPVSTWQAYTQLEKAKAKVGADDENIDKIAQAAKMSVKKAKSVYHTIRIAQVYSLNRTYDSEEKLTLEDIMTDEDKIGHEGEDFTALLIEYCDKANLTTQELQVLALRHGMLDLVPNRDLDVRVRTIEALTQNLAALGFNFKVVEPT
jgi:RNA polymerase sigma factor (sigma-70 family)